MRSNERRKMKMKNVFFCVVVVVLIYKVSLGSRMEIVVRLNNKKVESKESRINIYIYC